MITFILNKFAPKEMGCEKRRSRLGTLCGILGIFFNLLLFVLKLIVGVFSGAVSITADAFNNLSDAGSSVATLIGFFLASREPDSEHPFGHGRIEYISGIVISFIITFVGIELLKSSVSKILSPRGTLLSAFTLIVLILSVIIKLYMALYNFKIAKEISSSTIKAAAYDSISDCASTTAVLASLIIMNYTSLPIDGFMGAIVSLLIIRTGIKSIIDTSSPLLGNPPSKEFVKNVVKIVMENSETIGIHDLVVHDYGPSKRFVSLHMEVDGSKDLYELHDSVDLTERRLSSELSCEAIIHMDPIDVNNPHLQEIYEKISLRVRELGEGLSVHDLRIAPGTTHTNIIFDLVIPSELYKKRQYFLSELRKTIGEIDENYYGVITAELSYC